MPETIPVDDLCAKLFSKPDRHHLHNSALIRSAESGMRLHSSAHDDSVCFIGILINPDRHAIWCLTDQGCLHRGADLAARCLLGYAVSFDHSPLALCRRAAMASHGRNQKRSCALALNKVSNCFYDNRNVGNTAASHRDRNFHSRPDFLFYFSSV